MVPRLRGDGDNTQMEFQRSSGVLLHISSLPSYGGIGDLGPAAHDFVEFLAAAKQHVWQVLPLCPTGYGNSPYAGSSAFAGNPYLISLEYLADWGWIEGERIAGLSGRGGNVDFEQVEQRKLPLLYEAAASFLDRGPHDPELAAQWERFEEFCRAESNWLTDYAMYAELRRQFQYGCVDRVAGDDPATRTEGTGTGGSRTADALWHRSRRCSLRLRCSGTNLRAAAAQHGIRILGDVAIFVNMDSADVWMHPDIFELDENLRPVHIAGVPPDYFSPTGQRWGNPLYRWDVLAERGFDWWVDRIRRSHAVVRH